MSRAGVITMRLYSGKIGPMVDDLVRELTAGEDIEVEEVAEVRLDLEAVLKEYVRRERQTIDEAKDRMEREGLGYSKLGRMRQRVAKEMGFPQQDEVLPYLIDQLLNMLFHSSNVVEIYADDATLRKKMTPILRRHMEVDTGLDAEVRSKIKNLQEGTSAFEVEYAKVMDQLKHKRGLE
ncbi:MAG: DUF507 family protein [Deltaproteobacteria bacterium]|nr:MAG: DUF507 family protein [Deltaproteobacteria bacterium]